MSTATVLVRSSFARPPVAVRQFSVSEYHRMAESGLLSEDDRVELLEGWITRKMIHNPAHALAIENGQAALQPLLPAGWRLRVQLPITTGDSEPEPDLAIVRHGRGQRRRAHPRPADIALVIEVSDTTLAQDRRLKWAIYGRAGIPFYWVVNLPDRRIEAFGEPTGLVPEPGYKRRHIYGARKSVPLVIEGCEIAAIAVRDLLP